MKIALGFRFAQTLLNLALARFFPLPFGWIFWLGALSLFTGESLVFGWLSIGAIIGGFFVYQKDKEIDEAFNKVNKPFKEIDENLNELRKELEKIYLELLSYLQVHEKQTP